MKSRPAPSGTVKKSCEWNSWRQVQQLINSDMCRHYRPENNQFEGSGQTEIWIRPSPSLQSLISTLRLPSFWPPAGFTPRMPFWAESQRGWKTAAIFSPPACIASCQGGKSVFMMKQTLWKNHLYFAKDVPMAYVNTVTIVLTVSDKKKKGTTFVPPLIQTPSRFPLVVQCGKTDMECRRLCFPSQ